MALRLARLTSTRIPVLIDGKDEGDWLEVREDIPRDVYRRLMSRLPDSIVQAGRNRQASPENDEEQEALQISLSDGFDFAEAVFETLVTGWSLDAPVTLEEYGKLDMASSLAVDQTLGDYFQSLQPSAEVGKEPTP